MNPHPRRQRAVTVDRSNSLISKARLGEGPGSVFFFIYSLEDLLNFTRAGNDDWELGMVTRVSGRVLNPGHNVHALNNLAKDNMTSVQPACRDGGNEELCFLEMWWQHQ